MAKVKIEGIANVKKSVEELFNKVKSDDKMLIEIGEKTVELTQAFNRAGKSPAGGAHPKNSMKWELRKIALTKTNNPDEFYQPFFSNVTFTGQLLRSIKLLKINRSEGSVTIDATGKRIPYNNLQGKPMKTKKELTNSKLVEYLKEKKRIIFGINKQMSNVINRIVRKHLNERIKKTFK